MTLKNKNTQYKRALKLAYLFLPALSFINSVLPFLIKNIINKRLSKADGYVASIDDVDISLLKRKITLRGVLVDYTAEERMHTTFYSANEVEVKFNYKSLWNGVPVFSIIVDGPACNFVKPQERKEVQEPKQSNPFSLLNFPAIIKSFEIKNGRAEYTDPFSTPMVRMELNNLRIIILNLASLKTPEVLPTQVALVANLYGGIITAHAKVNILERQPTFDANMEINNVALQQLHTFFKAYANIDVYGGELNLYSEAAAANGKFKGYVKPLVKNLDISANSDKHDSFWNKVWGSVFTVATRLLENPGKDQIGTKIPFEGTFKDPNINIWYAIIATLNNAFIYALKPTVDDEINLRSVQNNNK